MGKRKYKFSVIVPVYNTEKYLRECITSVLCQSYSNFQLIAVDDGSSDNSGGILDEYASADSRIIVIHKQNQGPLLARVDAIQIADSDYCIFIDSDDLLDPDLFELLMEEIVVHEHDIFIYNYEFLSSNGTTLRKAESLFADRSVFSQDNKFKLYEAVVNTRLNSLWTKAFKTELLQGDPTNYSVFMDVFFGEDLLLSLYPLTKAKSIKYIDLPLYKYRVSEGSISRTFNSKKLESIRVVYKEMYKYLSVWDPKGESLNKAYIKTYGETLNNLFSFSLSQSSRFLGTKRIIQQISMNDTFYVEYLNGRIPDELDLSMKQNILRLLFKYKFYFFIFLFYNLKRIVASIAGKTV
jgi:glycosyltransferase involved in cell wall biosynthesis